MESGCWYRVAVSVSLASSTSVVGNKFVFKEFETEDEDEEEVAKSMVDTMGTTPLGLGVKEGVDSGSGLSPKEGPYQDRPPLYPFRL